MLLKSSADLWEFIQAYFVNSKMSWLEEPNSHHKVSVANAVDVVAKQIHWLNSSCLELRVTDLIGLQSQRYASPEMQFYKRVT